jgi:hypothetical protein
MSEPEHRLDGWTGGMAAGLAPESAGLALALEGSAFRFTLTYLPVRILEWRRIFLRLSGIVPFFECAGRRRAQGPNNHGRRSNYPATRSPRFSTLASEGHPVATEQHNQTNPIPLTTEPLALWGRPLAIATAVVFVISSAFPLVAGLSRNTESFPRWWGPLDVVIAFVLAMLALVVLALAQGKMTKHAEDASYRAYRVLIHGIFAMNVVFFLFGDRVVWTNCLTGFAWRAWLLLYSLPAWFTALEATAGPSRFARG